ncbi:MAG: glycosyltransferase family 39 protein [Candidatus Margulisbacteria bacterium]|nr:glycosyltransferase family 39 protein [Candidatus Margulisiibacteriota bacterium]MBU1867605.1 glycosyltransferase family 39 protein [Candidatus Margulisiibacteriota bacterium]
MNLRLSLGLCLALFILASFATLPRNPLQNDDASLYALAAKNAVVHNQWLAQYISPGDPASFLDKPPLGIWLLAWPMKLFGVSELTVHIPNVLYFALLLAVIYLSVQRINGRRLALLSIVIAGTSLGLVVYSRAPKLDILLPLFVTLAHFAIYDFIKNDRQKSLYLFVAALAGGFLVKSGFGLLLPGLTVIFLFIFNKEARSRFLHLLFSYRLLLSAFLLLLLVGSVLGLQALSLGDQWLPYLKSITIQSKYNTSYLGFGFYTSIIGYLLIVIFPWAPLAMTAIRLPNIFKQRAKTSVSGIGLNLNRFCNLWLCSNFLFLLFFYRQSDLRTFTVFIPPLAILAAVKVVSLQWQAARKPAAKRRGFRIELLWNLFFWLLFSIGFIMLLNKPYNGDGIYIGDALMPIAFFIVAVSWLFFYLFKPTWNKLVVFSALTMLAYGALFYVSLPLVNSFNPDVAWPKKINEYTCRGYAFVIYRPPDRQLFYSPDLFYVDFMAGPADLYFWDKTQLKDFLSTERAVVLSDTKSWEKVRLRGKVLAKDNYSNLIVIDQKGK